MRCASEAAKIRDGMTTAERTRRKRGQLKSKSEECNALISKRTKEAMSRPEVKSKLSLPRAPMSDDRKAEISRRLTGVMPKNMAFSGNNSFPNVKRGEYECSKGSIYFRSKWEANYALYLDFLMTHGEIGDWQYEPERFIFEEIKFGCRSYLPDFKVLNPNGSIEFHEVKGYMDGRSKTKLKRMAKYYPGVDLKVISGIEYRAILKQLKGIVNFY